MRFDKAPGGACIMLSDCDKLHLYSDKLTVIIAVMMTVEKLQAF
jgi:hypothetical protein